ncbi:MAG: hypothetical protein KBT32_07370 [Bacteroidales bacterium]|nr:hypothetical protein [Candidatus Physcocola equi]
MRTIFFAMSFILVAIASIAMVECASYARLRSEVEVQKENVEIARKGETEYKLNDSTKAVEIRALRLEKEQFDVILKEKDIQIDNLRKENRKKPTAYTDLSYIIFYGIRRKKAILNEYRFLYLFQVQFRKRGSIKNCYSSFNTVRNCI